MARWPLRNSQRYADVVMENLTGGDMDTVPAIAQEPTAALLLYGKTTVKPGRKMGHVNRGQW